MNLIIFCHPSTLESTSMPRFARMIGEGMKSRGHRVQYWTSPCIFSRLKIVPAIVRKWLGYIDQFLVFPFLLRRRISHLEQDTVFIFSDQALGMWVPVVGNRPSIIHCHDFLALRSSLGEFPENPTAWTGRQYQALIRRGFQKGRNFISVSKKTRADLHRFLKTVPAISEVVYNPLHFPFTPMDQDKALEILSTKAKASLKDGYLLHVGGNQWYKNRIGVVHIYQAYCRRTERPSPLLMAGRSPKKDLRRLVAQTPNNGRVIFIENLSDTEMQAAYAAAAVLIFPSLEEGFGWPIIEAQACGCPVITTNHAPMTEVGGMAAFYLPRFLDDNAWAEKGAELLHQILTLSSEDRRQLIDAGLNNVCRFQIGQVLDAFEKIYKQALRGEVLPATAINTNLSQVSL